LLGYFARKKIGMLLARRVENAVGKNDDSEIKKVKQELQDEGGLRGILVKPDLLVIITEVINNPSTFDVLSDIRGNVLRRFRLSKPDTPTPHA
jgi:hypothetical protein